MWVDPRVKLQAGKVRVSALFSQVGTLVSRWREGYQKMS